MAKSAIGSALGFITTVTTRVMAGMKGHEEAVLGLPEDTIKSLTDEFASNLLKAAQIVRNVLAVFVDYSLSLPQMIAAGKYDWVNPDITEKNFPVPENYVLGSDPKIFHFSRNVSSEDVVKEMDKEGYEPAMIWDLLDFGAKNPEEQRKFPIVGLGSVGEVGGHRYVPYLDGDDSERDLDLCWWGHGWDAFYRFLGVRKKVSQTSAS